MSNKTPGGNNVRFCLVLTEFILQPLLVGASLKRKEKNNYSKYITRNMIAKKNNCTKSIKRNVIE